MDYDFTEKENFVYTYHFYYTFFVNMQYKLKVAKDCTISKEEAREFRDIEKKKSAKEIRFKNSLIAKMINIIYAIPCNRKHVFEEYDLMLLIMRYLNKDTLSLNDLEILDVKEFYVKCLKVRFDKLSELEEKMCELPYLERSEQKELSKQSERIHKLLIPTEEEFDEVFKQKNGYDL